MKPWIIAALICSASAVYAAEDDNKVHPTCVEENNTRRREKFTGRLTPDYSRQHCEASRLARLARTGGRAA